ncbi:MAG: translation elongation factor Ts [Spirochaetaceae bacterium]|jgi:elongation factor Ts|nr:translation elongation factor Ts [Spirochaetaceae bacterium]
MAVTAADVKALRERTGAGPAECKNALTECNGDLTKAEKLLKEKGLAAAEKRAGRATNQGRITIKCSGKKAALVETSTETDFVARNPEFIALGDAIASRVLEKGFNGINAELEEMVKELATKIRENMALKKVCSIEAGENECLESYIHGDGAIGVVVVAGADNAAALEKPEVKAFIHDIALHIAAFNPVAVSKDKIDSALISEQEGIFRKQMETDEKLKGKNANVLDGILKGKLNKWLAEICLLDQNFVKNDKLSVAKALEQAGKDAGAVFTVKKYIYFRAGA